MSATAVGLALMFGIFFAITDRIAMRVGDHYSRNYGSAVWALLVLAPAIGLAVLSWKTAGVAVVVAILVSGGVGRVMSRKTHRSADPFAPIRPPMGWFR